MAMTALEVRPIGELTADDVRAFVAAAPLETETLEFKREAEGWAIRRAICGLANAYGGTFVVGIAERDGAAADLQLVPDCVTEAGKIAQGLAASVSPPLPGLQVRPIVVEGEAGVVVIRTSASARRPHSVYKEGRGEALHVFVRRGAETRSADIREVQDMTLVAASQAQRVRDRVEALQASLLERRSQEPRARLRDPFRVQLCAVPVTPIALPRLDADRSLELGAINLECPYGAIVLPHLRGDWRPVFRGVRLDRESCGYFCSAAVHSDGMCELTFWTPSLSVDRHDSDFNLPFPIGWFLGLSLARILWCEKIRRAAGESALEFALGDLIACDYARVELTTGSRYDDALGFMNLGVHRPDLGQLANELDVQQTLNQAVVDYHNLAGVTGPADPVEFDLADLRAAWGLA